MRKIRNFVNGKFLEPEGEGKYDVYNPAEGKVIATVPEARREDINDVVDRAWEAQLKWSKVPITDRIKFLFKLENIMWEEIDDLARITTTEHGKTVEESRGDIIRAIQNVESAAAATYHIMGENNRNIARDVDEELIRVPLGVFGIISPFNFPVMIPFWFIPYAIMMGNTVIVKPSEKTPMSMERSMEIIKKSGIPDGVVQMINGGGEAVNFMLENKKISGISFVGSTPVAKYVYEKGILNGKRVQAGASAKNFIMVMPDADLDSNMSNLIGSFFGNAGERCLAGSVLVTLPENHDKVIKKFEEATRKLKVGNGLEPGIDMGPLIRKEHMERVKEYIASAEKDGGKIILDGRKIDMKGKEGFFLGPTIIDDVSPSMKVAKEEIFGPVASVITANDFDEAIDIINSSRYGNASTIYTTSGHYAREYTEKVQAGNIGINIGVAAPIAFYPFSGLKESFFGDLHPQGGKDHILFFTERKVIISKW